MKLLSVAIPSYNSEAYMRKCIESLLVGGEDVEILIVNDGSTDGTGTIADGYAARYPSIVKAIHKENGGHGSAVNAGLEHATGLYFKVVDSDDWVKESAYLKILEVLRDITTGDSGLDICHMHQGKGKIRFGIYACSPEDSSFKAVFSNLQITECQWKAHDGQQPD